MKSMTVENMIAACKVYKNEKDRHILFESFRKMRFHGFLDEGTFDAFCEAWKNEFFN
jgi:hypothetical protein